MIQEKIIFGIDKKEISHFTNLEITQTINQHHQFRISVPHSVIETPRAFTIDNAQNWLGKVVHIALEKKNNFLGIVTNIQYAQELGHVGSQIILSGYSKTILLESGQKLHSWEDTTLQDMVREIIKTAANEQLQNDIKPEYTTKIDYQTQYLESDFSYIQRLAKQYNEWLYYDGEKLIFGKPKAQGDTIKLTYNKDLYNLNIALQATPNQFSGFTYNEDSNTLYQAQTSDQVDGLPKLGNQAFEAALKVYPTPSFEYGRIPTGDDMFLQTRLKAQQEATAADANYITATSSNNTLKIGSVIIIEAQQLVEKVQENKKPEYKINEIGTYIITEITHKATDIGEYENSFKALPAFIRKLPEPQITFPQAQMQQAIVVDNADPKGNGRIRVQLLWQQTKNLRTPWLRVMTPDAGTSGEVATNRGMVFIPEVGDHVMLGFRYNDPNRPFVIGSLFNGTIGAGGSSNNNIKSIFTRTGSTITFDEGQSSILVKDPSGNTWFMDGKGNIEVTAPKNITMIAGEHVSITAGKTISNAAGDNFIAAAQKNVNIIAGESLTEIANDDYTLTASNIFETAQKGRSSKAANLKVNVEKGDMVSSKDNIHIESAKEVNNNSGKKVKMQ